MVAEVQTYVPGYRLKQAVQFESIGSNAPLRIPEMGGSFTGLKVSVFLEVEGAAHYLPAYAGNLDIMTSAALKTAEKIALRMNQGVAARSEEHTSELQSLMRISYAVFCLQKQK